MTVQNNINVGKPDVHTATPTHTEGTHEGNSEGNYEKANGHLPSGHSTAARSTGINAAQRNPIDPRSPNLSPA